eukprot:Blabericola_migrator_1__3211@NODE_1945_length_3520_cov_157_498697_g1243_i0_p1_GENE_NODE_1945_length_3520_cov_157_498697_g1243_i0NODE_1945_length_3520_cov_157_498697_g1243_i0_p1_ORF_typecomplete_len699_score128_99MMR_HSR1/PF01926_23/3e03MMR_HSR1/PF01926_23/3_2e14RsgA_GTPase/PF03193_16/0_00066RsgA_GTPase/PF03193_16/9_2e05FeoB_N/PF02421_18/4_1FeoB_N/PF02421_18/1_9e06IIGP/PF05049_13/69IIGP/PF05049_13/0_079GTP_EFTU/PF00009_27/0_43GTP_EFTU/PF00009_27/54MnmE_helical/PF12631_7/1_3e03MnmE_helical/PF12631
MPCGRKSGAKALKTPKGGGFGKSLVNQSKPVTSASHDKPDYTRVRGLRGADAAAKVTDFISKERTKVSQIDPNAFDDFVTTSLTTQNNLVIVQKSGMVQVTESPEVLRPGQQEPVSLFSQSSIFKGAKPITLPPLSCPERPYLFRDPASRVLDFAYFLHRHHLGGEASDLPSLMTACSKSVSSQLLIKALSEYFTRHENQGALLKPEALEHEELQAFSRWRIAIANTEAKECITPYEKNLEYWRQLWRTVERSDIVMEIVDARNPLLFMASSLRYMVQRQGKRHMILMNKSDFLDADMLRQWRSFFEKQGVDVLFYSALKELENQKITEKSATSVRLTKHTLEHAEGLSLSRPTSESGSDAESDSEDHTATELAPTTELLRQRADEFKGLVLSVDELCDCLRKRTQEVGLEKWDRHQAALFLWDVFARVLQKAEPKARRELQASLEKVAGRSVSAVGDSAEGAELIETSDESGEGEEPQKAAPAVSAVRLTETLLGPRTSLGDPKCVDSPRDQSSVPLTHTSAVVGTCGFPNVGKSSVINSLMKGVKRVGVSRTPGKTRHLQTLYVPDEHFVLCDCPGLIFPVRAATRENLLINNILSPDTFKGSLVPALSLVLARIGDKVGATYGVSKEFDYLQHLKRRPLSDLAEECATVIAENRKFIAAGKGGVVDIQRTCRLILKDLHKGISLWYCEAPPISIK